MTEGGAQVDRADQPAPPRHAVGPLFLALAVAALVLTGAWWLFLLAFLPEFDKWSVGKQLLISLPFVLLAVASLVLAGRYRRTGRGWGWSLTAFALSLALLVVGWQSANLL